MAGRWQIFTSSIFFVLGFSVIFSLLGVLLQTVLSNIGYSVQIWLGRIGGAIIILFGLYILGLLRPKFLEKEHKFSVKKKFRSRYTTSFVFGAAFAVGWTPCVTAALGAILALATTKPSSAFVLLMTYTLGLGLPFLLVGLFTDQAQKFVNRNSSWISWVQKIFGVILVIIGILIFTNQLSRVANFEFAVNALANLDIASVGGADISGLSLVSFGVAFLAGLVSFLSPCVLPIIPGFLSYLAASGSGEDKKEHNGENKRGKSGEKQENKESGEEQKGK
ncbi:hypothetical protein GF323_05575 [Candidatus Woesearchaeota archaeon]|nr:hypothetical protein [Candidatus Woesearchaeota archaeon]